VTHISLKAVKEVVHNFGVILYNIAVFAVVITISSLDTIQNFKTLIKSGVKHHVVNGFFHLVNLGSKLILLSTCDFVMMVTTLSKRDLEILFGFFKLLFVLIKLSGKLLEKGYYRLRYFLHLKVVLFKIEN